MPLMQILESDILSLKEKGLITGSEYSRFLRRRGRSQTPPNVAGFLEKFPVSETLLSDSLAKLVGEENLTPDGRTYYMSAQIGSLPEEPNPLLFGLHLYPRWLFKIDSDVIANILNNEQFEDFLEGEKDTFVIEKSLLQKHTEGYDYALIEDYDRFQRIPFVYGEPENS